MTSTNHRRRDTDYIHPDQALIDSQRNRKILAEIQGINNRIIRNNLHQKPNLKISYCTTCYNRFWQLSKILRPNFNQVKDDPDIEFVVVDFHGTDSQKIQDFILENFPNEIQNGRLKYYRRKADMPPFVWNVAIAKNVAHRLATGDVLVNLDGDNFIQPNDSRIIRYYFNQIPKLLFHQNWCNVALINMFRSLRLDPEKYDIQTWALFGTNRGTFGRISMNRTDFFAMGGYNEQMLNMGNQDTDLLFRSLLSNFQYLVSSPRSDGNPRASIVNVSDIQNKQLKHNRELTQKAFKSKNFVVNKEGFKESLADYQLIKTNVKVDTYEIRDRIGIGERSEVQERIIGIGERSAVQERIIGHGEQSEVRELVSEIPKLPNNVNTNVNTINPETKENSRNIRNKNSNKNSNKHSNRYSDKYQNDRPTDRLSVNNPHANPPKCPHCGDVHSDSENE